MNDSIEFRSDTQWADLGANPSARLQQPEMGTLDASVVRSLLRALPLPPTGRIPVAQWDGYADTEFPLGTEDVTFPPGRTTKTWEVSTAELERLARVPMRWWHPDLTWVVGNDIYARSVFLSGPADIVNAVCADEDVETFAVQETDPVGAEDL